VVYDLGRRHGIVRPSPLFLAVLGVTAVGGLIAWTQEQRSSRFGDFGVFLFVIGGWIVSVCVHEFAHAYAAWRAGDRSVEARGYLTLNPFKYTHPVLSLLLPLVAIIGGGFALPGGAVYLNPRSFRTQAQRSLAAAAGPMTNVVFALVLILLVQSHVTTFDLEQFLSGASTHVRFWSGVAFLAILQLTAAVLNLLPIPGLDGYAIIEPYLDPETVRIGNKVKPWGLMIVIIALFYVNALKNAFFNLVDAIYRGFGGDEFVRSFGYEMFKWWTKNPL
jgi:Zn-dependent protease